MVLMLDALVAIQEVGQVYRFIRCSLYILMGVACEEEERVGLVFMID